MSRQWTPAVVLGFTLILYVLLILLSQRYLKEPVAIHFNWEGNADGWSSRSRTVVLMLVFGPAMAGFLALVFFLIRFAPASMYSLPQREYWTSPEVLPKTQAWLFQHSLWMSTAILVFLGGLHLLVVLANNQSPPHLSAGGMRLLVGGLFVFLLGWIARMLTHFTRGR